MTAQDPQAKQTADPPLERLEPEPPVPIPGGALANGAALLAAQLATLPAGPGVYRMLNAKGDALYVGKARSLRKRVATYTQIDRLPNRLKRMVAETARWAPNMELIVDDLPTPERPMTQMVGGASSN